MRKLQTSHLRPFNNVLNTDCTEKTHRECQIIMWMARGVAQ